MTTSAALLYPPRPKPRAATVARWIDVSNYQGQLRRPWFEHWSEQGYGGLIVQGVMGLTGESFAQRQLWAALEAGWAIAGYVWCGAGQAGRLGVLHQRLDYFSGFTLDFLALDIEEGGTTRDDVDASLFVCDTRMHMPTWIYTSKWVFDMLGWSDRNWWRDRKLWTARYDGKADVDAGFEPYGGWQQCDMKQWTDAPVDQNVRRV